MALQEKLGLNFQRPPRVFFARAVLISIMTASVFYPGLRANAQEQNVAPDPLALPEITRDEIINFALYTIHEKTVKLTAQLYPLLDGEPRTVALQIDTGGGWEDVAESVVNEQGWTATFRLENWNDSRRTPYRVTHAESATFEGIFRENPVKKNEIVLAAFTGNSVRRAHGGDISREDLIRNVKAIDADLLFFSGDQVYHHKRHYEAWMKFGRDFREIIRDRPTITIPDDHDVGQANLWGQGGKKSLLRDGSDGGYVQPVEYVKEVERAQTSHLPDPFDPTPIERGIGVYYTGLTWGRISFAILEDRKFKTGPASLFPETGQRADHITAQKYEPKNYDPPEAILLGKRQLHFLDVWGRDWTDSEFKVALSQTIFAGGAHVHGKVGGRLQADLDSNGWPQSGRDRAIKALRKSFAFHVAGDQHLGTVFYHGVNDWRDSIVSFCVPSIANLYLRWWAPLVEGRNRAPGEAPHLGDHVDGLANMVSALAVANPSEAPNSGGKLTTRAAGFGVVRFNKSDRTITMECWPRNVDITDPSARQYPGWPVRIDQTDNYGRKAIAWLPEVRVGNMGDPLIQIIDEETGEWVYSLRIKGKSFRPKVFKDGRYTIMVGEGSRQRTLKGVESVRSEDSGVIEVEL